MGDRNLSELGRTWPCAACTTADKLCTPHCIFAPLFPPGRSAEFAMVHKVFGEMNSRKLLTKLPPEHRKDAADSLVYEAEARLRDPLNGCIATISSLQKKLDGLKEELAATEAEIARYADMIPEMYESDYDGWYDGDYNDGKYVRGKNMWADHARIRALADGTFKGAAGDLSDEIDDASSETGDKSLMDKIPDIAKYMAMKPGTSKSAADHSSRGNGNGNGNGNRDRGKNKV